MAEIRVTSQNYELMYRLDHNNDGVIEAQEANEAAKHAGDQRLQHEARDLNPQEVDLVRGLAQAKAPPLTLTFGEKRSRIGKGDGQTGWSAVRQQLAADQSRQTAPLGTVGQERPDALQNQDCGPTSALYMHDRRIRSATGQAPVRTHAQADALIAAMSKGEGTTAPQMAGIMNGQHRHAGSEYYTFDSHHFTADTFEDVLQSGLQADPGGVMVPIISTYNADQSYGTRHWIVVTAAFGNDVHFYDPGGPDGARHEGTMTLSDLKGRLEDSGWGNSVVYGTHIPASAAAGDLKPGAKLGEVDVFPLNKDLTVAGTHGVFGTQEDADQAAQALARSGDQDAIVRQEGNGFAVYGVSEIRNLYGRFISDNVLTAMDKKVTAVWMTDPASQAVVKAPVR